ncbi:class I SAM-dependent methyltransferase [Phenylobacterium sp. 58.2.17]|jgi:ubiquinone/menaquinone biosynthesis C-methylase UbiE|uniref:class I SAM-dependent methyltransferase n=1 Tax=Phenylobacterium sp. 58.2.17 TaxID=2969306 RepID=UPI00086D6924|nr:class I SAM-dependent methyltransferase [Phenylobacterium sp. 58.2.17]MCX7586295.1 class I SAM-dependent methyltransferase [Phenylobacterium sp. 58.2.17]ODT57462.1 MAG: methyltransferase type 11 [Phenylobacterium sp. SCN 69-14]
MTNTRDFTPALGRHELTQAYDRAIALMTRERRWRTALLKLVAPREHEIILDVGCGTGTFALMLKAASPDARIIGVDPDPNVLALAKRKADEAGLAVEWRQGFGDGLSEVAPDGTVDKIVSSLVFHQCSVEVKQAILSAIRRALKPGGQVAIADYGLQRTPLMRVLFRQVQMLDGFDHTQPNADGVLPGLMSAAGLADVEETRIVPTPTGSISLYSARAPLR